MIFSKKRPYDVYLKSHQAADLFLDTWHYSAGSTAIAALSARLPMITVTDEQNAYRMGACIIPAAGLEDLICEDLLAYEKLAIRLAHTPGHRATNEGFYETQYQLFWILEKKPYL